MKYIKISHLIIFFALFTSPLYAYLDPGSGSMLLYALIGILTTLLYSFKNFYYRFIRWITGKNAVAHTSVDSAPIVIHSEGSKYWNVFKPLIEHLDAEGIPYLYVSPDQNDPAIAFQEKTKNMKIHIFKNELQCILFLNKVHADLVISTTPQLDVYMFTRSKQVKHYAHLIHAPTDVLIYKKFAFDFYDSVLCSGPHQISHLRKLESHRKTPPKLLLETGCTYFDELKKAHDQRRGKETPKKDKPTVLFAPTWGAGSAITKYEWKIFDILLQGTYHIIFRPHPQLFISQEDLIQDIIDKLANHPQVTIDRNSDSTASMEEANVLISDISGFIFDFAYIQQKPIILLETNIEAQGYESDGIIPAQEIWEFKIREEIAELVKEEDIESLHNIIATALNTQENHSQKIKEIREQYLFNYGNSGEVATKQIMDIYQSLQ